MLRFVSNIILSNPSTPEVPVVNTTAIVTNDDFSLAVGAQVAEQLKLEQITLRETIDMRDSIVRLVPYMGPVRVTLGNKEAFVGVLNCADGVVIGRQLAEELGIRDARPAETLPAPVRLLQEESAQQIMTVEHAIDSETIHTIREYGFTQPRKEAHVAGADTTKGFLRKDIRDSYKVEINPQMSEYLKEMMYQLMVKHVEPFYGVEIDWWEPPFLLLYLKDGHYSVHADASRRVVKPGGEHQWDRSLDRDISIILYINDEFVGGKLNFPDQQMKIQPSPGLLVAFPSTGQYRHAAEPTESGERLALVTWAAVKGSPRVRERPSGNRHFMNDLRKSA